MVTPEATPEPDAPHVYLSTACHHDRHGECRWECKFCAATCVCPCHDDEVRP